MSLPHITDMLPKYTFWDKYSSKIIIGGAILVFIVLVIILMRSPAWKANRLKKRYANSHRTVTLYGFKTVTAVRDCPYAPDIPVMEGHTFGGWFVDTALTVPWKSTDIIEADVTLYPKWF